MDESQLNIEIKNMGYTPFKVIKEKANFYKLKDETIMKIFPVLNAVKLENTTNPTGANINAQNIVSVFVPKELRGNPASQKYAHNDLVQSMDDDDVGFDILYEDFNEYEINGKWLLNVKTILSQVGRAKLYNNVGEPIYVVNTSPVTKFKQK